MKLCLGTVQFGMDYGVFNIARKPVDYCIKCLDYATQNGIDAIDTATAYGEAEEIVGQFLAMETVSRDKLFISTKLLPNVMDDVEPQDYVDEVRRQLQHSLGVLHTDYVDAYYYHSSRYAFRPELLEAISKMRDEGLARMTGVSVYYPDEAEACFNARVECIQMPYSIFDHRMSESGVFAHGEEHGCHMDVRTAFIKGLIRLSEEEVPEHLSEARPILRELDRLCEETGYSRIELAIGYIKREKVLKHLVFGIRSLEQLQEDIVAFEREIPDDVLAEVDRHFAGIPAELVVPSLWVK